MKSVKVSIPSISPSYPCLMEHNTKTHVVLFTSNGVGNVVQTDSNNISLGYHSNAWLMNTFRPYVGTITLENDL